MYPLTCADGSGSYFWAPGKFSVPDMIFCYFGAWLYLFLFTAWKIKGLLTQTQRGIGIPPEKMDFVTHLEEMERLTEQGKLDRENEQIPTGMVKRVLWKANDLLFERSF